MSSINFNHPQHSLPTFADKDKKIINCIIEINQGDTNKYEIQKDTGIFKLDRVMFAPMPYPFDYGLIPQTYDHDDDLLDVVIFSSFPIAKGALVEGRVIGIIHFEDTGEVDDKILVVPADDYRWKHIKSYKDLPLSTIEQVEFYWNNYKEIQFKMKGTPEKKTIIKSWGDVDDAMKVLDADILMYNEKYPDNPNK